VLIFLAGCLPDDVTDQPLLVDTGSPRERDTSLPAETGSLVGEWESAGDDVSELFAAEPYEIVRVGASFAADGTYRVDAENADGATASFAGTYVTGTDTVPATITLSQTLPSNATATGIWVVDGDTLTYEVVQTVPDYGYVPPTPAGGFGSTGGPDMVPGANVQVYVRR
jgi:hypothetical protein